MQFGLYAPVPHVTVGERTCRVAGASRFSTGDLTPRLACTRAWIATGFGPVDLAP